MNKITIYHYDGHKKFYLGKEEHIQQEGVGLPANSTSIKPPDYNEGNIPVFKDGMWVVEEDKFCRPKYKTITYTSGKPLDSYKPITISAMSHFGNYRNLPQICKSDLALILIEQRVRAAQAKYEEAVNYYYEFKGACHNPNNFIPVTMPEKFGQYKTYATIPSQIYQYYFLLEEMIMHMRSVFDTLVQITSVTIHFDEYINDMKIKEDKLGNLCDPKKLGNDFKRIFLDDDDLDKEKLDDNSFFKVLNSLSNSMKHSMMNTQSNNLIGASRPTIVSFYAKYNNHKKVIEVHNHDLEEIMLGFQQNVLRILDNQKEYFSAKVQEK